MRVTPENVHAIIGKHMLADGDEMVFDLEKSNGSYIYDSRHKRRLLDFATGFASSPIGYNHPKLLDWVFQKKLAHVAVNKITNSDFYTVEMAEFVDTFSRLAMPEYLPYLFLIEGGGPAVDNAIKAAIDWKIRRDYVKDGPKIIYFDQAFHGRTGYSLSVTRTRDPRKTKYFPKFDWINVLNPKIKFPLDNGNFGAVLRAEERSLDQIKHAFSTKYIAAIIIEIIQGEGGDNHFRPQFLQALRDIADDEGALLIFDEIQTGVGMTGKMWAHEHFEVEPDILVFGKKTQVCGIMAGRRLDEVENHVFKESSRINSTFGGNIVDMVRCQKYLEIIQEEHLVKNAEEMGLDLLMSLCNLRYDYQHLVDNVRGIGLMCAIDLPSLDIRDEVRREAYDSGLLILGCGEKSLRFRPPLNVSKAEIAEAMDILYSCCKKEK